MQETLASTVWHAEGLILSIVSARRSAVITLANAIAIWDEKEKEVGREEDNLKVIYSDSLRHKPIKCRELKLM